MFDKKRTVCYIITSWPKCSSQDLLPWVDAGWILPFQVLILPHSRAGSTLSWLVSHPLWGFLRGETPNPCSVAGDGGFNPHWSGQAGQGGQAATPPPEPKCSSWTFTKIFPCPIPGFPPSRGNSDLTFVGCCSTPDSKAELGISQNEGQLSCATRSIPALEEGLGQRALALGSAPRPQWEQSTPGFARW